MKFITVTILFTALFAVALSGVIIFPKDLGRCNYICHKKDVSACASNGICLNRFSSLCEMQTYNCLNPQKMFEQIEEYSCNESFQPICTKGDFQ